MLIDELRISGDYGILLTVSAIPDNFVTPSQTFFYVHLQCFALFKINELFVMTINCRNFICDELEYSVISTNPEPSVIVI